MFKPSGEHFLHGTIIIRAADFPDTEFTVVILFGFSIFKHHHGSHCFKPVNIGYIVGLYPADGWHLQQFPDLFHGSNSLCPLLFQFLCIFGQNHKGIPLGKFQKFFLLPPLRRAKIHPPASLF